MKSKTWFSVSMVIGLAMALAIGVLMARRTQAQEPGPQVPQSPQAVVGTAFTYQGRLEKDGAPVDGVSCTFTFNLYAAASGGSSLASDSGSAQVNDGLFSAEVDFGSDAFTGEARWLGISVQCPGDSAPVPLDDTRVTLNPAPYALALPGLQTQQNTTSPNLVGGYSGNSVSAGVVGATVGGGGASGSPNRVQANYATVGGGASNKASALGTTVGGGNGNTSGGTYATIGGGQHNGTGGDYATVGGGIDNVSGYPGGYTTVGGGKGNYAEDDYATVGGGDHNDASATSATVGGGAYNVATNTSATVGGGAENTAGGSEATVGGGYDNAAGGSRATVGGGAYNRASGLSATVGGGQRNVASGHYATVPGGERAQASLYGQMAYASGGFNAITGTAQASLYVMRATTTSGIGVWQDLYLDGSDDLLTIAEGRTLTFDILVVARSDAAGGNQSAGYYVWGVAERESGITTVWSTTIPLHEDDSAWDVQTSGMFGNHLAVQVAGNGETIRWVATVRTAEVSW